MCARLPALVVLPALIFVSVLAAPTADAATVPLTYPVSVRKAVQYGTGRVMAPVPHDVPLILDLYSPVGALGPRPAAIFIHGGGFKTGSRDATEAVQVARGLAATGVVVASIDYRLSPQRPAVSDRFAPLVPRVAPAPGRLPDGDFSLAVVAAIEDTLKAVGFVTGPTSGVTVDPQRVGLLGGSAGAITADHIAYVLDDYGIARPRIGFVGSLWGGILIQSRDGSRPASQLDAGEAPLFAAHGAADPTLPVAMSDDLVARARAQRVATEYIRMAGAGHDPPSFFTQPQADGKTGFMHMLDFARAALRP
jgi:para-nitrobenzyl esterase